MAKTLGDLTGIAKKIKSANGDLKKANSDLKGAAKSLKTSVTKLEKSVDRIKKAKPTDLKTFNWQKRAKSSGADKTVLNALSNAEKQQTRKSCEVALSVIKKSGTLKDIAGEIEKELAQDKRAAAAFNKATSAFEAFTKKATSTEAELKKQGKLLVKEETALKGHGSKVAKMEPKLKAMNKKSS